MIDCSGLTLRGPSLSMIWTESLSSDSHQFHQYQQNELVFMTKTSFAILFYVEKWHLDESMGRNLDFQRKLEGIYIK